MGTYSGGTTCRGRFFLFYEIRAAKGGFQFLSGKICGEMEKILSRGRKAGIMKMI